MPGNVVAENPQVEDIGTEVNLGNNSSSGWELHCPGESSPRKARWTANFGEHRHGPSPILLAGMYLVLQAAGRQNDKDSYAGWPTLVCGGVGCGKTLLAMEFIMR
jgi:hypothetical protein